jgi:S-phase kinase-associated protein 1
MVTMIDPRIVVPPYTDVNPKTHIVLVSSDGVSYEVSKVAAKMSKLIDDLLKDEEAETTEVKVIPCSEARGAALKYVVQYMEHHWNNRWKPIEKPMKRKVTSYLSPWDKQFLYTDLVVNGNERQWEMLAYSTMAANFLQVEDMVQLCCAAFAEIMKGKTAEQIRDVFNIECDFTPAQLQRIELEDSWIDMTAE